MCRLCSQSPSHFVVIHNQVCHFSSPAPSSPHDTTPSIRGRPASWSQTGVVCTEDWGAEFHAPPASWSQTGVVCNGIRKNAFFLIPAHWSQTGVVCTQRFRCPNLSSPCALVANRGGLHQAFLTLGKPPPARWSQTGVVRNYVTKASLSHPLRPSRNRDGPQ